MKKSLTPITTDTRRLLLEATKGMTVSEVANKMNLSTTGTEKILKGRTLAVTSKTLKHLQSIIGTKTLASAADEPQAVAAQPKTPSTNGPAYRVSVANHGDDTLCMGIDLKLREKEIFTLLALSANKNMTPQEVIRHHIAELFSTTTE